MRRLGDAAHLLGIRPWQWALMTVEQTDVILDWLDDYEESVKDAEKNAKK